MLAAVGLLWLGLYQTAEAAAAWPLQETSLDPVPAILQFVLSCLGKFQDILRKISKQMKKVRIHPSVRL